MKARLTRVAGPSLGIGIALLGVWVVLGNAAFLLLGMVFFTAGMASSSEAEMPNRSIADEMISERRWSKWVST
jgi:hypothetical protein